MAATIGSVAAPGAFERGGRVVAFTVAVLGVTLLVGAALSMRVGGRGVAIAGDAGYRMLNICAAAPRDPPVKESS